MEGEDYEPAPQWRGHDFKKEREAFDIHAGRSYAAAKEERKNFKDLIPSTITVLSPRPLFLDFDVTDSVGKWAAPMVGKTPLVDEEAKEYLGDQYEIVLGATGDAYSDDYPIQIRPPAKGVGIVKAWKELIIERGGGGQYMESYELKALYYARNVSMPNVLVKPPLIFIPDEKPYPFVDPRQALKYIGIKLEHKLPAKQVFGELKGKFSVYAILKPYGDIDNLNSDIVRPIDQEMRAAWQELLDIGHVLSLPKPERVVDVILGILGKECDKVGYFREEIESRQSKDKGGAEKIAVVYRSLEPLIGPPEEGNPYYKQAKPSAGKAGDKKVEPLV